MGRPRTIPRQEALELALRVFWEKGFEGTSIADLAAALQGGPSSLYNAFGSKEELFRLAIEHYVARYTSFLDATEKDLDVQSLVLELLRGAARAYTTPDLPPGCAIMQSGGAPGAELSRAAAITLEIKTSVENKLRKALRLAAHAHGTELASSPSVVAKFLMTTLRGMSQLAIDGASTRELLAVAEVAAGACVAR
jgi:AcrR family transcriptional regulator